MRASEWVGCALKSCWVRHSSRLVMICDLRLYSVPLRNAQDQDSDVDLMLIGKVSLRDIASPIKQAERQLGRRISPVIYSVERFAELLHSGNPFGEDVMRKPKKPIPLNGRLYTETELNDELRTMATERLVASS